MTKDEARQYIKDKKRNMSENEVHDRSEHVILNLVNLKEYENAETILTYVNYNQEVETRNLINTCLEQGKRVLVPKVYGKQMHFHRITSLDQLKKGKFGIPEPDNDCITDPDNGLMVMPGLAFDPQFNRVGYGGGFYDRYLEKHPGLLKVAVCFNSQILDEIQTEEYDLKPDIIVTEDVVYRNEGMTWNR